MVASDSQLLNNEAFESTPTTRKGERKRDTILLAEVG